MATINNTFRSKVMKAAWTSIRNKKSITLSQALKSAWAWAKKTLVEGFISIEGKITRETEKAVAIAIRFVCPSTDQTVARTMWIPKSLVSNGQVAEWFFNKKVTEIRSDFSYNGTLSVEF